VVAVLAVICSLQKIDRTTDTVSEPCHSRQDLWPGGKLEESFNEAFPSPKKCRAMAVLWQRKCQRKAV